LKQHGVPRAPPIPPNRAGFHPWGRSQSLTLGARGKIMFRHRRSGCPPRRAVIDRRSDCGKGGAVRSVVAAVRSAVAAVLQGDGAMGHEINHEGTKDTKGGNHGGHGGTAKERRRLDAFGWLVASSRAPMKRCPPRAVAASGCRSADIVRRYRLRILRPSGTGAPIFTSAGGWRRPVKFRRPSRPRLLHPLFRRSQDHCLTVAS
jgi:hypothetical protein